MQKRRYSILVNVELEIDKASDDRNIIWVSFKGWKGGIISKPCRLLDTEQIVKRTDDNMMNLGRSLFNAAREMIAEDETIE